MYLSQKDTAEIRSAD